MAGLYIHIPFCSKACHYCNFHFSTNLKTKSKLVEAIGKELIQQASIQNTNETYHSIYFGGGTPSLLSNQELEYILTIIHQNYRIANEVEFTLECNPDDINIEKLKHFKQCGVNRLSIGVQSFDNFDLHVLNRSHQANQALEAIQLSAELGFDKLSIDLMYGLPYQDIMKWRKNLEIVSSLPINHLSCYNLTVEEKTALRVLIQKQKIPATTEADSISQFHELTSWADEHGFEHYEISNFAKNKNYSKHNTSYWLGTSYMGVGPSAHSFDGKATRRNNIYNNAEYIRCLAANETYSEIEILEKHQQYNEFILTRLRTMWGIQKSEIQSRFGDEITNHFEQHITSFVNTGMIEIINETYTLTQAGKLVADHITSELFFLS